jgi:hypothetical protein
MPLPGTTCKGETAEKNTGSSRKNKTTKGNNKFLFAK